MPRTPEERQAKYAQMNAAQDLPVEDRVAKIESYLTGELDYERGKVYTPELDSRIETLELKIPAYEGHAEVIAEEAADMTGAYNVMQSELVHIREDIKEIKDTLHIIITKLK